ncbi:hypothetical protein B0J18DRAFT_471800 [Chaetomium sp. MPI-SDFR-AT-0129]|nr:hypothetical protein B0J18DRAFT_471800 [Chaetomium sp. MPI-SDFR-AT-0129]
MTSASRSKTVAHVSEREAKTYRTETTSTPDALTRRNKYASPGRPQEAPPGPVCGNPVCPPSGHAIFKNEYAETLIPKTVAITAEPIAAETIAAETIGTAAQEYAERPADPAHAPDQQPKDRRATEKKGEALIAAAVAAVTGGAAAFPIPETATNTSDSTSSSAATAALHNNTTCHNEATAAPSRPLTYGRAEERPSTFEPDSPEMPIPDRFKEFSEAMEDMIKWVQKMQNS